MEIKSTESSKLLKRILVFMVKLSKRLSIKKTQKLFKSSKFIAFMDIIWLKIPFKKIISVLKIFGWSKTRKCLHWTCVLKIMWSFFVGLTLYVLQIAIASLFSYNFLYNFYMLCTIILCSQSSANVGLHGAYLKTTFLLGFDDNVFLNAQFWTRRYWIFYIRWYFLSVYLFCDQLLCAYEALWPSFLGSID